MAFDGTSNSCWNPDTPIQERDTWRLQKAQFGDGYQQRTLDGINALDRTWQLTWHNRKESVLINMLDFLGNQKGSAFVFKDPVTGLSWNVFCDEWTASWDLRRRGADYFGTLTAEFYKANGAKV